MANRRTFVILASAFVVAAAVAVLFAGPKPAKAPPITFHFVSNDDPQATLNMGIGRKFWATNNTSRAVLVSVSIEIKVGSNWSAGASSFSYPPPSRILQFRTTRPQTSSRPGLGPHQAGYAELAGFTNQPSGTIWRAKANVGQELTGLPRVWAAITGYIHRRRFGLSGMPANRFSSTITYYGKPTEVLSGEIVEQENTN